MKKIIFIKVIALILFLVIIPIAPANAISKLDFQAFKESITTKVQKIKRTYTAKYNKIMSTMEEKVLKATGAEGFAVYNVMKTYVEKNGTSSFSNIKEEIKNGSLNFNNMISNFKNSGKDLLALAMSEQTLKDYKEMKMKVNEDKKRDMQNRLLLLQVELKSGEKSEEELESIAQEVASIEGQLVELEMKQAHRDEQREKLEKAVNKASEKVGRIATLQRTANEKVLAGLGKLTSNWEKKENVENKENKEKYETTIKDMFLGKYETENAENIARIRHIRDKEYYIALHEVFKTTTSSTSEGKKISDKSTAFLENTTEVDGLYGGMSMKIGGDIQRAKSAARYADMLIAEIRMNTTKEIIKWNNMYKLRNYKKDVTKFNLDDYIYKKGLKQTIGDQLGKIKDKAINKGKNKLNNVKEKAEEKINDKVKEAGKKLGIGDNWGGL